MEYVFYMERVLKRERNATFYSSHPLYFGKYIKKGVNRHSPMVILHTMHSIAPHIWPPRVQSAPWFSYVLQRTRVLM